MSKNNILKLSLSVVLMILITASCNKDEELPPNPYDAVDYGNDALIDTSNPKSFYSIHKNVFAVKCANPGCHDGAFEPDFRTVQSAYATLVFHPVVKQLDPWAFRVVPYDTGGSWLWQRLNHPQIISGSDTSDGQMPLYAPPLSAMELGNISDWIMSGAKDVFGQPASYPNTEPKIIYYAPTNASFQPIDTNRGGVPYNPFKVDSALVFKIAIALEDDSTPVANFTGNKLKFSSDRNDFSSATVYSNGFFLSAAGSDFWIFDVAATGYPKGDTVFMRYYTNDGDHPSDTEYPRGDMIDPYKTWWSFIVE